MREPCDRLIEGQPYGERGARAVPVALRLHPSTVHLHQAMNDGKAEAEATVAPCARCIRLSEALEHVRQEVGRDAHAHVRYGDARLVAIALQSHPDLALPVREL